MKKLLSLFIAVSLLFAATACSDGSSDDAPDNTNDSVIKESTSDESNTVSDSNDSSENNDDSGKKDTTSDNENDSGNNNSSNNADSNSDQASNNSPASDSSIIVGTWEGDLYVTYLSPYITPKLTFTFKSDGTYSHTLNPSSSHDDPASIGPGKWTFANNVVTMTPDNYPEEVMTPRYDPATKTLSWTVEDSGDTSITMTKKSSDSDNGTGSGSDSGFTGGSDVNRIGNYTLDFDDGNPIAVFAFDTNDSRFESYKMCFYSDKTVKVRVTPVVQMKKTKGKRYDYMTGTYEGDPTADGDISISFSKKLDYGYLFLLGTVKYENYDGTVPNTVTISDGKFTFKEKASSWSNEFLKTTKEDLLSYHYSQTDREDVNATEIVIPEGYSKIPGDCFRDNSKLAKLIIPSSVKEIYYSFYSTPENLEIVYKGTKENWKKIKVCGYADDYKTVKITCTDGELKFSSIERDFDTGKSYVKFEDK